MYGFLRRLSLVALAMLLLGGTLTPLAAQAAPAPASNHRIITFSPNPVARQVMAGATHELFVLTHFNAPRALTHVYFTVRFNGDLYGRPATSYLGTVRRGRQDLAFVVVVPARTRPGSYLSIGRLFQREGRHDNDRIGAPLYVRVRVVARPPLGAVITWQPSNHLGLLIVRRGGTITETVSFSSDRTLTNARLGRALSDVARDRGARVTIVSPTTLPSVAAHTPVPVVFTVAAADGARFGGYAASLYIVATVPDGRRAHLRQDLDFAVRVTPIAPVITWQPANHLGLLIARRGQTVTETVSFTSAVALTNLEIHRGLGDYLGDRGVSVGSVSPATLPSVAANTPVNVTFVITAGIGARLGNDPASLYVVGTEPGGPRARLRQDLDFTIGVRVAAVVIHWQPTNQLGVIAVRRGATVTETASFTSDVALSNAQLLPLLSDAAVAQGVTVTAITPASLPSVAANTPVNVTFSIAATADARLAAHPAGIDVVASAPGSVSMRLYHTLRFTIRVTRIPPTTVAWAGGSYVTFPAVARGTVVTETASFTTSANVSNASLEVANLHGTRGVRVTVVPLSSAAIAANTPVTVNVVIDTTQLARPGFYGGIVYVVAQPADAAAPHPLHLGLHFTGAVQ